MKYTIGEIASLAGVSTRTLRHYDQLNLLRPKRQEHSRYRYYDETDIDTLQQILLLRNMDVSLYQIKQIIQSQTKEDRFIILSQHLKALHQKQQQIDTLITTIEKTIQSLKGEITMSNNEKFKGLKEELIQENEKKYKEEVVEKWGNAAYEQSKKHFWNLSPQEFQRFTDLGEEIISSLKQCKANPNDQLKIQVAKLHREWITLAWGNYNEEAHLNVVDLYINDERFKNYYDQFGQGLAQLLHDSVFEYLLNQVSKDSNLKG